MRRSFSIGSVEIQDKEEVDGQCCYLFFFKKKMFHHDVRIRKCTYLVLGLRQLQRQGQLVELLLTEGSGVHSISLQDS